MPKGTIVASRLADAFGILCWITAAVIAWLALGELGSTADTAGFYTVAAIIAATANFNIAGFLAIVGTLSIGFAAVVRAIWQSRH